MAWFATVHIAQSYSVIILCVFIHKELLTPVCMREIAVYISVPVHVLTNFSQPSCRHMIDRGTFAPHMGELAPLDDS